MQLAPYLFFGGSCAQALELYKTVFGGTAEIMLMGDAPPDARMPETEPKAVMHATFTAPGLTFMASDGRPGTEYKSGNISMSIATDVATGEKLFAGLSDGAMDVMPLQKMFWGATFGQLTDKFGVDWMFNLT